MCAIFRKKVGTKEIGKDLGENEKIQRKCLKSAKVGDKGFLEEIKGEN